MEYKFINAFFAVIQGIKKKINNKISICLYEQTKVNTKRTINDDLNFFSFHAEIYTTQSIKNHFKNKVFMTISPHDSAFSILVIELPT